MQSFTIFVFEPPPKTGVVGLVEKAEDAAKVERIIRIPLNLFLRKLHQCLSPLLHMIFKLSGINFASV